MRQIAAVAALIIGIGTAAAAEGAKAPLDTSSAQRAVRVSTSPRIDGDLTDPAWAEAPEITGFTQRDPDEGKAVSEPTAVKVVYDDDAIYVAARLDDSHPVTTRLARRDTDLDSDWFRVYLDPHHDKRSGAGFWVNPSNVQIDMALFNDSQDDWDWDAVWESATKIRPGGWDVEIRIPYSQLRFPAREDHVWGVNFIRVISRRNEQARLAHTPKNEAGFVSRFTDLGGIRGVTPKRALELMPYGVSRGDLRNTVSPVDPYNDRKEWKADAGLDLKYGLTSNLTLTGTINPDFGQVEVDPTVVNLSAFETFFPEKRPFFIEGASMFSFGEGGSNWNMNMNIFPPSFFYTRRIGRQPQGGARLSYDFADVPGETTILGAAKLTGKTSSGWSIGVLDALTDKEEAEFTVNGLTGKTSALVEPSTNYLVARAAKDIGTRGKLGILFTSVNRDLNSDLSFLRENAYSGGIDGYWSWGERDVIMEGFLGGSIVDGSKSAIAETQRNTAHAYQRPDADHIEFDPERTSLTGLAGRLSVVKQTGKWRYNVQAQGYTPGFETNDVGFLQRTDIVATHAGVLYSNVDVTPRYRERFWMFSKFQNWNTAGDLIANGIYWEGELDYTNYTFLYGNYSMNFERYDDRQTRGGPLAQQPVTANNKVTWGTDTRKKFSLSLTQGNSRNTEGGYDHYANATLRYKPTSNLSVSLTPSYDRYHGFAQHVRNVNDATAVDTYGGRYVFANLHQTTLELGTRVDWTFNSRLTFQLYLQPFISSGSYSNFKELSRPGTYDYAVYGSDLGTITYDADTDQYTVDPDAEGGAKPFTLRDPDFNQRSLLANAIVRWEFRPGSSVYFVWNENRQDPIGRGDFDLGRDMSAIGNAPADDVFMVKVSYWIGM